MFSYFFDDEFGTCTCWFKFIDDWNVFGCPTGERLNPLHAPGTFDDRCISEAEYQAFLNHDHGLGPACIATAAQDANNVGDDDCPPDLSFDFQTCRCGKFSDECTSIPFYCLFSGSYDATGASECDCVTPLNYQLLLGEALKLGPDCIAGTFDDDEDNVY